MKLNIILIFLTLLLTSCSSEENLQHVFSEKTNTYTIQISTIDTKINSSGQAQCSKYVRVNKSDSSYSSYGLDIQAQLAHALHTNKKYITNTSKDLEKKYLKIDITNSTTTPLNYDSIIQISLAQTFHINPKPVIKQVSGYTLTLIDSNKLKPYKVACNKGKISYNDNVWTCTASQLLGISKIVDNYSKEYINFQAINDDCYTFDFIINKDIDVMNDKLSTYGLFFKKDQITQTFYDIKNINL